MKALKKDLTLTLILARLSRLAVIVLAVFALVFLPYRLDLNQGSLKSSVLLADDGDGDGDGDWDLTFWRLPDGVKVV